LRDGKKSNYKQNGNSNQLTHIASSVFCIPRDDCAGLRFRSDFDTDAEKFLAERLRLPAGNSRLKPECIVDLSVTTASFERNLILMPL
jgi:hypothetical protein